MTESLRKITARTVGMDKGANAIDTSFIVYGRVINAKPEVGDLGDYVRLKGTFEAVNEQTGEYFRAPVFIAPGGLLENEIMTALNSAKENGGGGSVDFGARFKVVKADNPMGAEWRAEMLTQPAEDDPVQRIKADIQAALPNANSSGKGKGKETQGGEQAEAK